MARIIMMKTFNEDPISMESVDRFEYYENAEHSFIEWVKIVDEQILANEIEPSMVSFSMILFDDNNHVTDEYHQIFQ